MAEPKQVKSKKLIIIVALLVALGATYFLYGQLAKSKDREAHSPEDSQMGTQEQEYTNQSKKSATLEVKGFYIGMNLDDAVKLLNEKYKDVLLANQGGRKTFHIVNVMKDDVPPADEPILITNDESNFYGAKLYHFDHFISFKNSIGDSFSNPYIEADNTGKVIKINFNQNVVNKLFNVADMDVKSFIQTFINNYSIPEMSPFSYRNSYIDAVGYTSDKGVKVIITEDKELIIEKVPDSGERQFD